MEQTLIFREVSSSTTMTTSCPSEAPASGYQIFCSAHSDSFEQNGMAFLAAINLNSPGLRVVIEIVNPSERLKQALPELQDAFHAIRINLIVTEASFPVSFTDADIQSFSACQRIVTLTELLKRTRIRTLTLDVEAFVKKDLSVFFRLYSAVDFAVYFRPTSTSLDDRTLANGVYVDPRSRTTLDFMAAIVERIRSHAPRAMLDQESIAHALSDFSGRLKVADVQKVFLDFESNEPSFIWAKSRRKGKPTRSYLEYRLQLENSIGAQCNACLLLPQVVDGTVDDRTAHWLTASLYRAALSHSHQSVEIVLYETSTPEPATLEQLPHQTIFIPKGISCPPDSRIKQCDFSALPLEVLHQATVMISCLGQTVSVPNPNYRGASDYLNKPYVAEIPESLLSLDSRALIRGPNAGEKTRFDRFSDQVKATAIRTFTPRLKPTLFKGKRIALVGNSRSLLEKSWGNEIDAHDIVVRFNLGYPFSVRKDIPLEDVPAAYLAGIFEDTRVFPPESHLLLKPDTPRSVAEPLTNLGHTGSKTTIWVCATVDQRRQEIYSSLFSSALCVWPHPTTYANINKKLLNPRLRTLNPRHFFKFKSTKVTPSSGLIMFEFLRSLGNYAALDLYGFDFFASGHQIRNNTLLHEKKRAFPHQGNFESDYIRAHVSDNSLIRIRE